MISDLLSKGRSMRTIVTLFTLLLALLAAPRATWAQHDQHHDKGDAAEKGKPAKAEADADGDADSEKKDDAEKKDAEPKGPIKMHVGVELANLSKFEIGPGTYIAEFYLRIRCDSEPCKPDPDVANGKITGKEKLVDDKLVKEMKVKAELSGLVDLTEFPFDEHVLPIQIIDKTNPTGIVYELDREETKIAPDIKLAGWSLQGWAAGVENHEIDATRKVSEFQYGVKISRPTVSAFFKSFVPVFFMIFVAGFTLLLKPKSAAGRLATATGGLMSVVMFHLSSTSSLPPMGYLTRLDKFMIAMYFVYLVNIAFSVAMVRFEEKKDEKRSELSYLAACGAVPGVALIALVTVFMRIV